MTVTGLSVLYSFLYVDEKARSKFVETIKKRLDALGFVEDAFFTLVYETYALEKDADGAILNSSLFNCSIPVGSRIGVLYDSEAPEKTYIHREWSGEWVVETDPNQGEFNPNSNVNFKEKLKLWREIKAWESRGWRSSGGDFVVRLGTLSRNVVNCRGVTVEIEYGPNSFQSVVRRFVDNFARDLLGNYLSDPLYIPTLMPSPAHFKNEQQQEQLDRIRMYHYHFQSLIQGRGFGQPSSRSQPPPNSVKRVVDVSVRRQQNDNAYLQLVRQFLRTVPARPQPNYEECVQQVVLQEQSISEPAVLLGQSVTEQVVQEQSVAEPIVQEQSVAEAIVQEQSVPEPIVQEQSVPEPIVQEQLVVQLVVPIVPEPAVMQQQPEQPAVGQGLPRVEPMWETNDERAAVECREADQMETTMQQQTEKESRAASATQQFVQDARNCVNQTLQQLHQRLKDLCVVNGVCAGDEGNVDKHLEQFVQGSRNCFEQLEQFLTGSAPNADLEPDMQVGECSTAEQEKNIQVDDTEPAAVEAPQQQANAIKQLTEEALAAPTPKREGTDVEQVKNDPTDGNQTAQDPPIVQTLSEQGPVKGSAPVAQTAGAENRVAEQSAESKTTPEAVAVVPEAPRSSTAEEARQQLKRNLRMLTRAKPRKKPST